MSAAAPTERFVLTGRVVTMAPAGVIDNGAIYVDGGTIEAVQERRAPPPDGFADAPRINTGDTIFPGFIELHNHLSYNVIPLWDVPDRYENNAGWRGTDPYSRDITKPSQVLGQTNGAAQALVRYVECRAMLGGATTSQGLTLYAAEGLRKYYRGLVRNVESPLDDRLSGAGTKVANVSAKDAQDYLDKRLNPVKETCYLQHLSEGVDDTARGWFLNLRIDEDTWAVNDVLCGIHCTALEPEDFEILGRAGASMVWSPLSNYLLYGATTDIAAAKAAGVNIALGSDWAPSGSKNLLGELKVAWLASQHAGDVFTPEELVAMVTINPARAAKWDHLLGSIQPGHLADLVVVNGRRGDPFESLLKARETSLTLVLIDGVPRVGQHSLMRKFWGGDVSGNPAVEPLHVGGSSRYVYLEHDADLLESLSLGDAIATLRAAMADLPRLAGDVDQATAMAVAAGTDPSFAVGFAAGGDVFRVAGDFEQDDLAQAQARAAAAGYVYAAEPYAYWVTKPIALPGITVADDPAHLVDLLHARNLPEFVKKGLPGLYGKRMRVPQSARFLESAPKPVAEEVMDTTDELSSFLRTYGELSLAERKVIVDQALLLLESNYVHLPLKRAMHASDPVQRLRLLRSRLEATTPGIMPPEIDFHSEIMSIFNSIRDLHTGYRLPMPFASKVAWLPFLIEEAAEVGETCPTYLLARWVGDAWPDEQMRGAVVTHWNGMRIDVAVARNADRQAGSNLDARHARGLNSLTVRPLVRSLPPDEEWVTLTWLDGDGTPHDYTQRWLVYDVTSRHGLGPADLRVEASALGLDDHTDEVGQAKKDLYAGKVARAEARAGDQHVSRPTRDAAADRGSYLPGVFRARLVKRSDAGPGAPEYAYIRIFTFNVRSADAFVDEFVRLTEEVGDHDGLIVDVRGNGGGLIYAAEQLLQVFTAERVEPERAQFINTPLNLRICRTQAAEPSFPGLDLAPWVRSMEMAVRTGATYSLGFPITAPEAIAATTARYRKPVVLITDPLSYSATDMFAAGFQDHGIGKLIGVGGASGAGGANVWSHGLLSQLLPADPVHSPYRPLPGGADLRVAIRRTIRVKEHAGEILEDLGVEPDLEYRLTKADVMGGNEGLIDAAIDLLAV